MQNPADGSCTTWRIRVPATTANLGPGFDCFGLALQRYLTMTVQRADEAGAVTLNLSGEGADILPCDETNLIYQSFLIGTGLPRKNAPGLVATIDNEIPLARGQGSSAAAAVAGLAAGHLLAQGTVDRGVVINQGTNLEGHPDNVAPAVLGGLVVTRDPEAVGRMKHTPMSNVCARSIPTSNDITFVLAVPEFEMKTSEAREILPTQVELTDAVFNLRAAAWMAASWVAGDWDGVAEAMDDRLHQPYRARLIPGFYEVCDAAREAGALAACLSGAGPTILALTLDSPDAVAHAMTTTWAEHGIVSTAETTGVDTEGLVVTPVNTSA